MTKNPLAEAELLFRRRRWAQLIKLLEPVEAIFHENVRFLFLLGAAYLQAEDIGAAYGCLRRGRQLDFRNVPVMASLAAVHVRRGESDKAIQLYIEILEREPKNVPARRGLDYLRRHANDFENHDSSSANRLMKRLYPVAPARAGRFLWLLAALALGGLLAVAGHVAWQQFKQAKNRRPEIAAIWLSAAEVAEPVGSPGSYRLVLVAADALAVFEKAKNLFQAYRDEAALVEINRLLNSNASPAIKAKATLLRSHARDPSFLSLPDRFNLAEVAAQPYLYEGVAVAWKGLPANIRNSDTALGFDFLVGYQEARQLEGIVEVQVPFAASISEGQALELLAVVRPKAPPLAGFYLECVAIHPLLP